MDDIKEMYFSQTALRTYLSCPYRFKKRYIDGLYWRYESDSIQLGSEFHLDMKRHFLGLPLSGKNSNLVSAATMFLPMEAGKKYLPEYTLRYNDNSVKITVRYDLLVIGDTIEIYDWKVGKSKLNASKLATDIQTQLYLYTMASAGQIIKKDMEPADISITYFNPFHPSSPVHIDYDSYKLDKNRIYISGLVSRILKDSEYALTTDKRKCIHCEYNRLCNGKSVSARSINGQDSDLSWDDIEEISF